MTTLELAARAGISRGLVQRIEKGDPRCAIGSVFEAAAILGIPLFDAGQTTMTAAVETNATILSLLPKAIRARKTEADDDF